MAIQYSLWLPMYAAMFVFGAMVLLAACTQVVMKWSVQ